MQNQIQQIKYRANIAYIGTQYKGFQFQNNGDSIQAQLEKALSTLLRQPIRVRGASRTDSGVHAEEQVVSFYAKETLGSIDWRYSLNAILPKDIAVREIQAAEESFDPINDSTGKVYRYRLWKGHCTLPHVRPYVWAVPREIDFSAIEEELQSLVGIHDFTSFCAVDSDASTKVRHIFEARFEDRDPLCNIWISGGGFLKQMVRIIAGTLVDVGLGRIPKGKIPEILKQKQRDSAGQTAPPQGLSLVKVLYNEKPDLVPIMEEATRGYCIRV